MAERSGLDPSCPRCGEPISGTEAQCPSCGLDFLDAEGGLSQEAIDAMLDDADIQRPGPRLQAGYYTPAWVRLLVGLAISVPMAPLVLFVVESVVPIPLWIGGLVFLVGWFVPGYLLSRRAVPSVIVATGLLLLGITMAVTPLAIVIGRTLFGTDATAIGTLGTNVLAAQTAFLAIGLVVVGLGAVVYRHAARTRDSWAEQAAEMRE